MASIGENLRRLRKALGLTQGALAEKAGVSQQLVSQLERGENEKTLELPALAKALGVSVHQIDEDYSPDAFAGKVSGEKQIMDLLRRIDRLPPDAIVPIYGVIAGFIRRGGGSQTENLAHDQSETSSPHHEAEPSHKQPAREAS